MKSKYLPVIMLLMTSVAACVSAGTVKLSENDFKKVIEGKSSKDEVAGVLGRPEQSLKLDEIGVDTYVNRVLSTEVAADMFPEGQYEVWIYNKWSYFAVDPLLIPSHESAKISLLIFNSSGVCIKKFYEEEGKFKF